MAEKVHGLPGYFVTLISVPELQFLYEQQIIVRRFQNVHGRVPL